MSFSPSNNLKQEVAELLTHYPEGEQRSASLMVLRPTKRSRTPRTRSGRIVRGAILMERATTSRKLHDKKRCSTRC